MEPLTRHPARLAERALFYGWAPVFVLALWPYTTNPCEPPKLLVTAGLALCCSILAFFGPSSRRGTGLCGLLVLWLGWQVLCGLCSGLPENSLWALVAPAAWVLTALAARRAFADSGQAWRLVTVIVVALGVASLYGFAQRLGWDPFPWSSRETVEYRGLPSTFGNPNFAGHALVPGIILALALATRPRCRVFALAAVLAMVAHLWFTGMRGGPVALSAAAVLFGAWRLAGWFLGARGGRIPLALALAVLLGLATVAGALSAYRATHATWLPVADSSLVLRYNSAHGAARMILDHPMAGLGPGNYERLNAAWWTPFEQRWYALRGLKNDHVHCEPLEAGVEGGVPGVFLYFLLFCWAVLAGLGLAARGTTLDQQRLGLAVALCAFAMAVDGLFGFNLHVPVSAGLFFVLLGVLDAVSAGSSIGTSVRFRGAAPARAFCVLMLAIAVLFGTIGRFRADSAALRDQGVLSELATLSPADPERTAIQNALMRQLARDRDAFPPDPRFAEMLGRVSLVAGHFEGAGDAFADALADYPANPDTLASLAKALHGQAAARAGVGDWSGAAFLLRRAEAAAARGRLLCAPLAAPHDALWRIADLRGEMARSLGVDDRPHDLRTADQAYAALEAGVADPAAPYRTLARIALRAGRPDEAAEMIGQALEQEPDAAESWLVLERVHSAGPTGTALLDAVSRAYAVLKKDRPQGAALLQAAWWLTRLHADCPALAMALAGDAIHVLPGEPGAWGLLAQIQEAQIPFAGRLCAQRDFLLAGSPGVAVPAVVDLACAGGATDAGAVTKIAEELAGRAVYLGGPGASERIRREFAWAVPLLKEAGAKSVTTPAEAAGILAACAALYNAAELWKETESTCAEALPGAVPDTRAMLLLLRSNALAQLGRRDEALATAREAVQTSPSRKDVQWNLAQRLAEAGMDSEAQYIYKILLQQLSAGTAEYGHIAREYEAVLLRLQNAAAEKSP